MNIKNNKITKKQNIYLILGVVLSSITIISLIMGSEAVFAPMLTIDFVFLLLWKFKPDDEQLFGKNVAFRAIIAFGLFSALASIMLSIVIPIYAEQWNIEKHIDNAFLYPIVNDGRENCYISSLLFIFYIGFSLYYRKKVKNLHKNTE